MKNIRGDIPITILVLGVVAICGLAILSFVVSNNLIKLNYNDALGLNVFEQVHSDVEKFEFYTKVGGVTPDEAVKRIWNDVKLGGDRPILDGKYFNTIIEIVEYTPIK